MTKLSIIIPVYNAGKYINRTLESTINQTFKDFEVICINDCSTDNSLEIIENFAKKYAGIKIINNEQNIGSAMTRNVGIDAAKGEYIYFLDADDYIDKKYLECMVKKIEQEKCDIILNLSIVNEKDGIEVSYKHPSMPEFKSEGEYIDNIKIVHDAPCFIWARMYRKEFLDKFKLRFIKTRADDVVFNAITTIYADKTFVFCGEKYHYVIHNEGIVGQENATNTRDLDHIKAHSVIYDFLKERGKLDDRLKLFRVYPFMKVDTKEKFDCYKKFFDKIKPDFQKNESIYNEMEKYFAYSLLNTSSFEEYLKNYNKIVTIGFLRRKK